MAPLAAVDPDQAVTSHQPGDLAATDLVRAAEHEFGVDTPDSVGRPGSGVDLDDHIKQVGVGDVAG